jgi:hypothetical protein
LICVSYDGNGTAFTGAQDGSIIKWGHGSIKQ